MSRPSGPRNQERPIRLVTHAHAQRLAELALRRTLRPLHPGHTRAVGVLTVQARGGEVLVTITWLRRFHLLMMAVWVALAVPGIIWWKDSITFVIILSLYANFAGEFAAYQGARHEEHDEK